MKGGVDGGGRKRFVDYFGKKKGEKGEVEEGWGRIRERVGKR